MSTAIETGVNAFRATLVEQGALSGTGDGDAADVGRRAALLVRSATAWQDHLGPLLDVRQAMEVLGVTTRQAVHDLTARHRLLGLVRQGGAGKAFPAFQFDASTGRPYVVVAGVLGAFAAAEVDSYTVATWLATDQDDLEGRSPSSVLGDPDAAGAVLVVAERAAARLSH